MGNQSTIGKAAPTENGISAVQNVTYPGRVEPSDSSSSGNGSTVYSHGVNGYSSSSTVVNAKQDLPPTPLQARVGASPTSPTAGDVHKALPEPKAYESDGTVRGGGRRDPSYGSDESEEELRADLQRAQLSSPIPPTMLDSVVIPAIGSVRTFIINQMISCLTKFRNLPAVSQSIYR